MAEGTLDMILEEVFPELSVDESRSYSSGTTQSELIKALLYVKDVGLIEDAKTLCSDSEVTRNSVTYPIFFSGNEYSWYCRIEEGNVQTMSIYVKDEQGQEKIRAVLYDMRLEAQY